MKIVYEMNSARPNLTDVVLVGMTYIFQKHIKLFPQIYALLVWKRNSHIDQGNPMEILIL